MSLVNLNIDCQLLIMERLDVLSLLSLSETNRHFSMMVENILRRKFVNKSISVTGRGSYATEVEESEKSIRISSLPEMLWLLKNYCHLISHLKIENVETYGNNTVYKYVDSYCSKTLTQIHLESMHQNVFDAFSTPFSNVEHVSLSGEFNKLDGAQLRFDQLFPAMRRLSLGMLKIADDKWMERNRFAHLEHIGVLIWLYNQTGHLTEDVIIRLIQYNPQIQSLRLENVSPKFLQIVANQLPKLEHLDMKFSHVIWRESQNLSINFGHLKSLKIQQVFQVHPNQFVFNDLEELDTDANVADFDKWMTLIKTNEHLKKLRITRRLKDVEFQRMTDACSHLTELSLTSDDDVEDTSIFKIFENCEQLERVHLAMTRNSSVKALSRLFQQDWTIKFENDFQFTVDLKRKN